MNQFFFWSVAPKLVARLYNQLTIPVGERGMEE